MPSRKQEKTDHSGGESRLLPALFFAASDLKLRILIVVLALISLEILLAQTPPTPPKSSPTSATPAPTPGSSATNLRDVETSKLDNDLINALNRRDNAAAVPLLEELIVRLVDSKNPEDVRRLSDMRFQLGVSAALIGDYPRSADAFGKFVEGNPRDSRIRQATEFRADSLYYSSSYDEAAAIYQSLVDARPPQAERVRLLDKVAECYVAAENWQKALPVLRGLLNEPLSEADRQKHTIALLRGLIAIREFDEFLERFPALLRESQMIASSLPFNAALVDAGESLLSLGQPSLAIPVLRAVRTLPEIRSALKASIEQMRTERTQAVERREVARAISITGQIARAETQLKAAEAESDYTSALSLRLMRAYQAANRPFEAYWITRNAYYANKKDPLAEVLCLSALRFATLLKLDRSAIDLGLSYLTDFPTGKVWDEVGIQLAQIFLRVGDNEKAIAFADRVLATKPDSAFADQLILTRGLARLNLNDAEKAKQDFLQVRTKFPDKDSAQQALYWTGVANLRLGDFAAALGAFDGLGNGLPQEMAIDVPFRKAIAFFGLERYEDVIGSLGTFLENGAPPRVRTRARMLLSDAYGALGRLDEAFSECQKAVENALNQTDVDEATFMACRILEKMTRYEDIEQLLDGYLGKYGTNGDFAQAYYLRALAQRSQGRDNGKILDDLWAAISKNAYNPLLRGVDRLMDLFVDISKGKDADKSISRLDEGMKAAKTNGERAAELRYARSLVRAGNAVDVQIAAEDLEISGPETLLWIATAQPGVDAALRQSALLRIIEKFPDSDAFPAAALEHATQLAKSGDHRKAITFANRAIEAAPMAVTSAKAYKLKGDSLVAQKKYEEAIKEYESVLQVREWRGELWPEVLFRIGECQMALNHPKEAYAYFQRIYVLYSFYKTWTAKAYLRCAEISRALGLNVDAVRTLNELLADQSYANTKEYSDAKKLLQTIQ